MSTQKKWQYGDTGTLIQATMRQEDLVPCFVDELRRLGHASHRLRQIEHAVRREGEGLPIKGTDTYYYDSEIASDDLEWLFNALDEHAKDHMYFGATEGDGSDYGFWLSTDFKQEILDEGGIEVSDTSQVPEGFEGKVLHVNDHGNATLYTCKKGAELTEIWSVV